MDPKAAEGHIVPSVDDLTDEAFIILSAAQDTTGNAMTIALYETISNPEIYAAVVEEIKLTFPDPNVRLDFLTLEKLPYLVRIFDLSYKTDTNYIRLLLSRSLSGKLLFTTCPASADTSRLSYGVIGRLPRVTPSGGAEFNGISIPAGVGKCSFLQQPSTKLFLDCRRHVSLYDAS